MTITIRPARQEEQQTIVSLIHQAKINPRNLHWERFLVAEEKGQIIGIRQVKIHTQGTREVGSGFVLPKYQHQRVSAQLMEKILAREAGPLYLMCRKKWSPYYEQFGFRPVRIHQLPADFRKEYWVGKILTSLVSIFTFQNINIVPMKREQT
jgi:N-acetylglutamate synthase-like GNAT family acetyltransferase